MRDSTITATVGGGPNTVGGNITIDPEIVLLQNSQIVANAAEGRSGSIRLTTDVLLADPASRIDASSALGIDGEVAIQAPVTEVSGVLVPLSPAFAGSEGLLSNRCAARLREGSVSSLVVAGRGGVPAEPDGGLPSPLYSGGLVSAATAGQSGQPRAVARAGQEPRSEGTQESLAVKSLGRLAAAPTAWMWECGSKGVTRDGHASTDR